MSSFRGSPGGRGWPSLIHGWRLCGRHELSTISRRASLGPAAFCGREGWQCDPLSGQRGVAIVHTLYTGGCWTCILVPPWNFRLVVFMRPNVLEDMTCGHIVSLSARRSFLVTLVHAPHRCFRHDHRVPQARQHPTARCAGAPRRLMVWGTGAHLPIRCCLRSKAFQAKRVDKLPVKCGHAHDFPAGGASDSRQHSCESRRVDQGTGPARSKAARWHQMCLDYQVGLPSKGRPRATSCPVGSKILRQGSVETPFGPYSDGI